MTEKEWEIIKKCAACEPFEEVPGAFIVDSPGYPATAAFQPWTLYRHELWLDCCRKIKSDFPSASSARLLG